MRTSNSYRSIFKVTTLLASVKVTTVLVSLVKNKVVALLLGASGAGVYGILSNTVLLINSISDLGLSKSAIRNISESNGKDDLNEASDSINIFRVSLLITSFLTSILTMIFAEKISFWAFGNYVYKWHFFLLGIAIFMNSISTGQLAVLQGLRKIQQFAKVSSYSSMLGLVFSLPFLYFLKEDGIVISILVSSLVALILSYWFLSWLKIPASKNLIEKVRQGALPMIYLGLALMMVSFMFQLSGFILRAYITRNGSLEQVGIFYAGFTIITGYFGMIFTAMSSDYYPRLSAVNKDNKLVKEEVNKQATIALVLIGPLVSILLIFAPIIVRILFSSEFVEASEYVKWAVFGIIFQVGSQTMGMVLIAKNKSSIFIWTVLFYQTIFLLCNIAGFNFLGVKGLGITFSTNMLIHFLGNQFIMWRLYKIRLNHFFYKSLIVVLLISLLSYLASLLNGWLIYAAGVFTILLSFSYSWLLFKQIMEISSLKEFILSVKNRLFRG